MEKELKEFDIHGTVFLVDVNKLELREKEDETNIIRFDEMEYLGNGYRFDYDVEKNRLSSGWGNHEVTVTIPEFSVLDPIGMGNKYKLSLDVIKKRNDYDIMVDPVAYDLRVNKGMLPTIDIERHTFYVDIRMDKLRPKDDFLSNGIAFSHIEDYFNDSSGTYLIPYNPKTREMGEIDYENITEIPKNLVVIEFPNELKLDPIGWNRQHGFDLKDGLMEVGLQMSFTAKKGKWEDIYVPQKIKENLDKIKKENKNSNTPYNSERKKGRKM